MESSDSTLLQIPSLDVAQMASQYGVSLDAPGEAPRAGFGKHHIIEENNRRMKAFVERYQNAMSNSGGNTANDRDMRAGVESAYVEEPEMEEMRGNMNWAMDSIGNLRAVSVADSVESSVWSHLCCNPRVVFVTCKVIVNSNAGTKSSSAPLQISAMTSANSATMPRACAIATSAMVNSKPVDVEQLFEADMTLRKANSSGTPFWSVGQVVVNAWKGFEDVDTVFRLAGLPSDYRGHNGKFVVRAGAKNQISTNPGECRVGYMYTHPDLIAAVGDSNAVTMYHLVISRAEAVLGQSAGRRQTAQLKTLEAGTNADNKFSESDDDSESEDDERDSEMPIVPVTQAVAPVDPFDDLPDTDRFAPERWVEVTREKVSEMINRAVESAPSKEQYVLDLINAEKGSALSEKTVNGVEYVSIKIPDETDEVAMQERLRQAVVALNLAREEADKARTKKNQAKRSAALMTLSEKRSAVEAAQREYMEVVGTRERWVLVARTFLHIANSANLIKVALPDIDFFKRVGKIRIVKSLWESYQQALSASTTAVASAQPMEPMLSSSSSSSLVNAPMTPNVVTLPHISEPIRSFSVAAPKLQGDSIASLISMIVYPGTVSDTKGITTPGSMVWKEWLTGLNPLADRTERCTATFTVAFIPN